MTLDAAIRDLLAAPRTSSGHGRESVLVRTMLERGVAPHITRAALGEMVARGEIVRWVEEGGQSIPRRTIYRLARVDA